MIEVIKRTVVIKPVPSVKFSGVSSHTGTGTSFEGAQLGRDGYKTGLTREEEATFCEELGYPKGTLSKDNDIFWGSILNKRLANDKPSFFKIETLLDEIKFRAFSNRNNVAPSKVALKSNPRAEFYIEDREIEAKAEEITINYKMEAMDAMRDLSLKDKKGYLKLYGKKNLDDVSDAFINTQLFKEVDNNPKRFLELHSNPDVKLRISIEEMIEAGSLVKKGNYYSFQNEVIGNSVEAVIAFFKDLKNQSIKIAAESEERKGKGK